MASQVIEYSADDTAEGFLRWYRREEPTSSSLPNLHKTLMPLRNRRAWSRALRWVPILAILVSVVWYIFTFLLVLYNLPLVFPMSFERLAIHDPVWCGMSTLDYMSFYCFNGTVDVRIQNKLWWNVEILDGLYIVWRPRLVPAETQIHYYTQVSTLNVVEVPSKSDRTYTLKTVCVFPEALARFDLTAEVLAVNLNIRVLGYNFHIANQKQKQDTLVVDLRDSAQKELPSN